MTPRNGRGGPQQAASAEHPDLADHSTRRRKRTTCRYHCRTCGRHFASAEAFDQHRRGSFAAPVGGFEGRRCVAPDIDAQFEPALGICRIAGAREESGQTVWRLPAAAARVRVRFAQTEPEVGALAPAAA